MTRRLRVGVVVPGWSGPDGPPALPALQEQLWRLAADHDLRVVALRHPPVRGTWLDPIGLHVTGLGLGGRAGLLGRAAVLGEGVRALQRLHTAQPFDVLHGFWADEPGAVVATAARVLRRPAIVSVMGGELVGLPAIGYGAALGRGGRWTVATALRGASLVTVGSGTLFRAVAARESDVPLRLLPLGVDLDRFAACDAAPDHRYPGGSRELLFAGSLVPVKDPVLLLRAFARMRTPEVRLTVAGDGPMRPDLERLAERLGIADRARFAGALPRDAMPDRYRAADLLVVTSWHEAQLMVAVEAAACRTAVVGTAVGVVPELAAAGGGVAIGGRSPSALAAALDAALRDDHAVVMGRAAHVAAARRWGGDRTAAAMADAWSQVLHLAT